MKKDIFKIVLEIVVISITLVVTFPAWQKINAATNLVDKQIETYQSLQLYSLDSADIDVESDFRPAKVAITNNSSTSKETTMVFKYVKLSTFDYNNMIVNINGVDYDLSSMLMTTTRDFYVFRLDTVKIDRYSSNEYVIAFKIKEGIENNEIYGKYFDADIEIV